MMYRVENDQRLLKIIMLVTILILMPYFNIGVHSFTNDQSPTTNSADVIKPPLRMISSFGDYRIGALVPVHIEERNKTRCMVNNPKYSFIRGRDGTAVCYRINDSGAMWAEAMRYAVLEVNRQKLLGDTLTLGYDIRDSVNSVDVALTYALDFTSRRERKKKSQNLSTRNCSCSLAETTPYVVALIGGARSEISQRVNNVLSVTSLPQISYSSTSVALSNKNAYRTFMRTIPPDNYQAKAMADIARHFGWHYVATVATDEDYGRRGVLGFHEEARKLGICISNHLLFDFTISAPETKEQMRKIVKMLKDDIKTNVIVLFCERPRARAILEEAQRQGMTGKTWIASEDWGSATSIYEYPASVVGGILGVVTYEPSIEKFTEHLRTIKPNQSNINPWFEQYFETIMCGDDKTKCKQKPGLDASGLHRNKAAYVMDSVYTIAHALRTYIQCQARGDNACPEDIDLNKLRQFMLQVNFTGVADNMVAFDEAGDAEGKYQITNLQPDANTEHGKKFVIVGTWINGKLNFDKPIIWNGWKNATPVSNCSFPCPSGKYYVSSDQKCCWTCVLCPVGQIKVETGNHGCDVCPVGYTSNENHTTCLLIPEQYIKWSSITATVLITLSLFGVLVTTFMLAVYFKHQHSPIVKASSRYPSLSLLVTVILIFLLPFLYIGRPDSIQCHAQPIAFGLLMTLATSLVFTKTFRLIQIFHNVVGNLRDKPLVKVRTQFFIVAVFIMLEVVIISIYLDQHPIKVRTIIQDNSVPIDCGTAAKTLQIVVLLYNGALAIICAFMAFRARSLPANFSEARLISFAMFTFSVIWITFLITYSGSLLSNHSTFICVAILATAFDLIICMFLPKVWVILFRPELNAMHVVRADIYKYTLKQRSRSHGGYNESSETENERDRINTPPEIEKKQGDFDTTFQESKL